MANNKLLIRIIGKSVRVRHDPVTVIEEYDAYATGETGKAHHAMILKSGDLPASGTENLYGRRFSDYVDLVVPFICTKA